MRRTATAARAAAGAFIVTALIATGGCSPPSDETDRSPRGEPPPTSSPVPVDPGVALAKGGLTLADTATRVTAQEVPFSLGEAYRITFRLPEADVAAYCGGVPRDVDLLDDNLANNREFVGDVHLVDGTRYCKQKSATNLRWNQLIYAVPRPDGTYDMHIGLWFATR